jgi:hypothetical protein
MTPQETTMSSAHAPAAGRPQQLAPDGFGAGVRYLRRNTGLTEADLADATGASTRTVRRWTALETDPQNRFVTQIDDLLAIVKMLEDSLTPKGTRQWLRSRNGYLSGARPIDHLREGRFAEVREAAVAFRDGVYL